MKHFKCIGQFIVGLIKKEDEILYCYTSRSLRKIVKWLSIIIAILFMIGSFCFVVASVFILYPNTNLFLMNPALVYFIGSIFFTSASYLQYLQVINADITNIKHTTSLEREWIWFAYRWKNLGFLASFIQLIGTVLFNLNTYDGMINNLTYIQEEIFISMPNVIGSICFLLASFFAWLEVYHDKNMKRFSSVLWWIIWLNILGSVFFGFSAIYGFSFNMYNSNFQEIAVYFTMFGGMSFLIASYLLIPETQQKEKNEKEI